MPELPEIETIRIGLNNIINKKISQVFRSDKKLRIASTLDLKGLNGSIVKKINRRARYLLINFDNKNSLIVHLGMSGRLVYKTQNNYEKIKHDHFICEFDDGSSLIYNDPRRFGFVDLITTKNIETHSMLAKLGPEPFDEKFDAQYLLEKLQKKTTNIKTTMMDNEIVVGVGNTYINESLFLSKISPLRAANSLNKNEIAMLVENIKQILQTAINQGGSSINDYVDAKGNLGNFQNNFRVYGRQGKECLVCEGDVDRIVQNGRSSFYCRKCQK